MTRAFRLTEQEFDRELAKEWRRQNNGGKLTSGESAHVQRSPAIAPASTPPKRFPTSGVLLYPLVLLCEAQGLPAPIPEYPFARDFGRLWRLDYAWPTHKVGVEIDGGAWIQGRHNRGAGFIEDQRKGNMGIVLGWRILHYTPDRLTEAVEDLRKVLA